MMLPPKCWERRCKWYLGVKDDGDEETERHICEAFPDGIPDEITYGNNPHTSPIEGDNGIQFEEAEEE